MAERGCTCHLHRYLGSPALSMKSALLRAGAREDRLQDEGGCAGWQPGSSSVRESHLGSPAFSVAWPRESRQAAFRTRARGNTNPARPYICRLIVFTRWTECPDRHTPYVGRYSASTGSVPHRSAEPGGLAS